METRLLELFMLQRMLCYVTNTLLIVEILITLSQAVKLFWAIWAFVLVIACLAGKRVKAQSG